MTVNYLFFILHSIFSLKWKSSVVHASRRGWADGAWPQCPCCLEGAQLMEGSQGMPVTFMTSLRCWTSCLFFESLNTVLVQQLECPVPCNIHTSKAWPLPFPQRGPAALGGSASFSCPFPAGWRPGSRDKSGVRKGFNRLGQSWAASVFSGSAEG